MWKYSIKRKRRGNSKLIFTFRSLVSWALVWIVLKFNLEISLDGIVLRIFWSFASFWIFYSGFESWSMIHQFRKINTKISKRQFYRSKTIHPFISLDFLIYFASKIRPLFPIIKIKKKHKKTRSKFDQKKDKKINK